MKTTRRPPRWVILVGLLIAASPLAIHLAAQGRGGGAPPPPMFNKPEDPLLQGFRWRGIGPVGQGARIDDYAVDEKNPSTFYVGFAVSGVWKTVNNGTTFEPIFQTEGVASIGDLALAPSDPNILWVGTGEANNRQTTTFGNGIWKSTDAGKTFTNMGLQDSQSIGRIVVHPKDPNIVWVAVAGHLFGPNQDRGIYMTTDGGKNWQKVLYIDQDTGGSDLIIDPANPMNLWATMYQHRRTPYGYVGGGPGSGIYASTDGGKTWKKLTAPGLPHGTMGRVALDISRSNPNVLYAQIEVAQDKEPKSTAPEPAATEPPAGRGAGGGGAGGGGGRGGGQNLPPNPQADGIWKSIDHGKTWTFMNNQDQRPMYFSQIRVDPNDPNTIYVGGVNAFKSTDGGKTMFSIEQPKGHVDNHAIWIDPLNSKHVMYGDDGGMDVSWDGAATFESPRLTGTGLAYHASVDLEHPYNVCVGLQDNGSWCGPSSVRSPQGIRMWDWMSVGGGDGFQNAINMDNPNIFYTESQNLGIQRYDIATGEQRGVVPRCTNCGGRAGGGGGFGPARGNVVPEPPAGTPWAFNWNSPIVLSHFDQNTIYVGGKEFFISRNGGDTWRMSTPLGKTRTDKDLDSNVVMGQSYSLPGCSAGEAAAGGPTAHPGDACILSKGDGMVANEYGTLTEIAESPVQPGVLWAGTDDGNIQVSKDDGFTFTEVGHNIPGVNHMDYVSGIEASWYDAGTAYVALDAHRRDDLKPYIFKTTDYGQTWKSVSGNLPAKGNVNSIRQDPVNQNLLYAPTEFGFYISLNDGQSWSQFMPGLPTGRMDEVVVHPREHDLILAAHGYSVQILDDVTALEQMTSTVLGEDAHVFKPRDAVVWKNDVRERTEVPGEKFWMGENAPRGTAISYYLKSAPTGDAKVTIADTATGQEIFSCTDKPNQGLNRFQWALESTAAGRGQGGGGRGNRGGGAAAAGGGAQGAGAAGPIACTAPAGGGGRGFGGGGGGRGGGGGGVEPGVYKVTVNVGGKDIGSETFKVLEDIWLKGR